MNFNVIFETLAPYLGTTTIGGTIIALVVAFVKIFASAKSLNGSIANIDKMITEGIKKVIPEKLYVKVEGVAKEEFAKMKAELLDAVDKNYLNAIKENTEVVKAVALALSSMKAIPDSQKEILAKYTETKPETTEALVVELVPVETETKKTKAVIME